MTRHRLWIAFLVASGFAATARAHFLFVRICGPAEGGRAAEVYFSELAAAGDPRYIDKVAGAKFWVQTTAGQFRPLEMHKMADRLRAHVPTAGAIMVAGQLDYGVLSRPMAPMFLLRHYSKAVAGSAEEVNRMAPKGTNLEIVPKFEKSQIILSVLLGGKPVPGAKVTWVDSDLSGDDLTADAQGNAVFTPPASGFYSIYTPHLNHSAGEHQGEAYKEIREFATIAFRWPLEPAGADAEAVKLFQDAIAARATWQDFPGFSAKVSGDVDDRPFSGTVKVAGDGAVTLDLEEDVVADWVQQQLESITMHRAARGADGDRPQPVLRFADDHLDHPLGRLLEFEGGQFATSYRVKNGQISVVNRLLDGKNMTITVLSDTKTREGRSLPHCYTVQYWDDASGKLGRAESIVDDWARVGASDLPAGHTVTTSSENGVSVRTLRLTEHQLNGATVK